MKKQIKQAGLFIVTHAIPVSAAIALVLGIIGYANYRDNFNLLDHFLSAARLFTGTFQYHSDARIAPCIPWYLTLARYLAIVAIVMGLIKTYHAIIGTSLRTFKLGRLRNHAIVCGLGERGELIVRELRRKNKQVVIIESNPAHPLVESNETKAALTMVKTGKFAGTIVLTGDAVSPDMLERAGITRASELHVVLGDDNRAVAVASVARRLCQPPCKKQKIHLLEKAWRKISRLWDKSADNRPPLKCETHVRGAHTRECFNEHEIFSKKTPHFSPRIIDDDRLAARHAMIKCARLMIAPTRESKEAPPHIVVVGAGPAGQAMLVQMAHILHPGTGKPLDITVIDKEDEDALRSAFDSRYPFIQKNHGYFFAPRFLKGDITSCGDSLLAKIKSPSQKIDGVLFCINNEKESLRAALQLRRRLAADGVGNPPIIVCSYTQTGLAELFQDDTTKDAKNRNIHIYNMTRSACELFGDMGDAIEAIAKDLHDTWRKNIKKNPPPAQPNPNDVDWENLSETKHDSNRDQAADLFLKLACCGYSFEPGIADKAQKTMTAYTNDELDVLADMEHRRWMVELYLDGWTYNEMRDNTLKHHDNLVAFQKLKPSTRKLDFDPVIATPQLLAAHNYKIWRQET